MNVLSIHPSSGNGKGTQLMCIPACSWASAVTPRLVALEPTLPTAVDIRVQVHLASIRAHFQIAIAIGEPRVALHPALDPAARGVGVRRRRALDGRAPLHVLALPSLAVHELIRFRRTVPAPTPPTSRIVPVHQVHLTAVGELHVVDGGSSRANELALAIPTHAIRRALHCSATGIGGGALSTA